MHAVFCVDSRQLRAFAVTATSLAVHRPATMTHGFLISTDIEHREVAPFFEWLETTHGLHLDLIHVSTARLSSLPVYGHVSLATYVRLLIGEVLPDDVETVLYLDSDIVVNQSLEEALLEAEERLYAGKEVIAVVPESSDQGLHLTRSGAITGRYFQAGSMVIHLQRWRANYDLDLFLDIRRRHKGNILWWDQDILNIAMDGRWLELPQELNGTPGKRTPQTVVYHFAGNQKPWRYRADVQDRDIYEKYRRMTKHLRPLRTDPKSVVEYYFVRTRQLSRIVLRRFGLLQKKTITPQEG